MFILWHRVKLKMPKEHRILIVTVGSRGDVRLPLCMKT